MNAILFAMLLGAGAGATLQGTVRSAGSLEPIAGALVELPELRRWASADAHGYFMLPDIPAGRWRVRASALGYRAHELVMVSRAAGTVRLDFELQVEPLRLSGIPVYSYPEDSPGSSVAPPAGAGPPPARLAGSLQLKYAPGLAEPDVLRAAQQLPSVAAISDFSSALYVRGGAADQNLITLDGVPLFNPYHLGGVFGAVNADAVAAVEVRPGALPAREADRVGGVVHIHTRAGSRDRVRASGGVGLISSNATVDGPLPGGRGSFLVSARRTYLDAITGAAYATGLTDNTLPYRFSDLLLKATQDVGSFGSLSATVYLNPEAVQLPRRMQRQFDGNMDFDWGSRAAAIMWRQPIAGRFTFLARTGYSDFHGKFRALDWPDPDCTPEVGCFPGESDTTEVVRGRTLARDAFVEAELGWHHREHTFRLGARADNYDFRHWLRRDVDLEELLPNLDRKESVHTVAAFVENEWQPLEALALRAGVRVLSAEGRGTAVLPRIGGRLQLTPGLALNFGAGRYAQAVRSMRTDESVISSFVAYDLLAAQPDSAGLLRGEDAVLGLEWSSTRTSARLDIYGKRLRGLTLPMELTDAIDMPPLVVDSFALARGSVLGIELDARHNTGPFSLHAAYSYTRARYQHPEGDFVPRFERRHWLELGAGAALDERTLLTARVALGSGQPFTPALGTGVRLRYDPARGTFEDYGGSVLLGEHNSRRLPMYARVDVAARRSYDKRWFGHDVTVTPYLQVLNLFNMKNVVVADPQAFAGHYKYLPQVPVLPTFGAEWRF